MLSFVPQILYLLCPHSFLTVLKLSGKELNQEETYVSFFKAVLISLSHEAGEVQVSTGYG